jgi:O-acetyl-ADP-ribose deacetylase (regulator of RNase III)
MQGNVLDIPHGIIVHGCNAQGKMKSGIAKEIRARFPGAYDVYMDDYNRFIEAGVKEVRLGNCTAFEVSPTKWIVNGVTQRFYGRDKSIVYVDYKAIQEVFDTIVMFAPKELLRAHGLHFPKIGCGLANGDWAIVSKIIDDCVPDSIPKFYWEFNPE